MQKTVTIYRGGFKNEAAHFISNPSEVIANLLDEIFKEMGNQTFQSNVEIDGKLCDLIMDTGRCLETSYGVDYNDTVYIILKMLEVRFATTHNFIFKTEDDKCKVIFWEK